MKDDAYFLRQTFVLADKARGFTSPNPLVGAVIVKGRRVIARGWHKKCGGPHAEIEAFRNCRQSCRGATLYLNLEPCCHFGRTPPCVDEVIKQGIKRVVVAMIDPDPRVNGKSLRKLRQAGIKVTCGVLRDEAQKLNEVFVFNVKHKQPFVAAKIAQTLDGKIASSAKISRWITSAPSREAAKKLRDKYDCVLVGVNTVVVDDPGLDGIEKIPFKVIIDPHLRIPRTCRLMKKYADKLIIFTSAKTKVKHIPRSVQVIGLPESKGALPVKAILKGLYALGMMSVFVEGGSDTLGRFFDAGLVNKMHFFIAPKILGGRQALTSLGGRGFVSPDFCPRLSDTRVERVGADILITGYPV